MQGIKLLTPRFAFQMPCIFVGWGGEGTAKFSFKKTDTALASGLEGKETMGAATLSVDAVRAGLGWCQ